MLGSRLSLRYRWDSVSSLCQRSDFFILWGFFIFGAAPCLALTPASAQGWLVGVLFLVNPHRTWNVLWELQRSPVLGSLLSQGRVWGIWAAQGCCVLLVSPVWAAAAPELTQGNFPEGFPNETAAQMCFCQGASLCTGCSVISAYILLTFAKQMSGKFPLFLYFLAFPPLSFTRLFGVFLTSASQTFQ